MRHSWGPTPDVEPAPNCLLCGRSMAVSYGGYAWCTSCEYPDPPPEVSHEPGYLLTLAACALFTFFVIGVGILRGAGTGYEMHAAPDYFAPTFEAMVAEAATEEAGNR